MIPRQPAGVPVFGCCSTCYVSAFAEKCRDRDSTASMVPIPPDHRQGDLKDERAFICAQFPLGSTKRAFVCTKHSRRYGHSDREIK